MKSLITEEGGEVEKKEEEKGERRRGRRVGKRRRRKKEKDISIKRITIEKKAKIFRDMGTLSSLRQILRKEK